MGPDPVVSGTVDVTLLSNGWRQWEQCGGNESSTMPYDLQKSIAAVDRCDGWLSRRSSNFDSRVTQMCLVKWWRKAKKSASCIHPEPLTEPAGPSCTKWSQNFFLKKMKKGGKVALGISGEHNGD